MAKKPTFNANKKPRGGKKPKKASANRRSTGGQRSNAWRAYTGGGYVPSTAPIPD